eukprot:5553335-Prymnesium_polylepis.3
MPSTSTPWAVRIAESARIVESTKEHRVVPHASVYEHLVRSPGETEGVVKVRLCQHRPGSLFCRGPVRHMPLVNAAKGVRAYICAPVVVCGHYHLTRSERCEEHDRKVLHGCRI